METEDLSEAYARIRSGTPALCAGLEPEDHVVQPIDDVSPPKWHLAHTSWFFEAFVLRPADPAFRPFHEAYEGLFNSYYRSVGTPYPRTRRGTLSRPTVRETLAYRRSVDERVLALLEREIPAGLRSTVELGLHHEQQHQELLAADIKYILAHNGLPTAPPRAPSAGPRPGGVWELPGGAFRMGREGPGFAFDNEGPSHPALTGPFRLAQGLVTNAQFKAFIDAGGYADFRHWLSDGWDRVCAEGWRSPLHWDQALDPDAPACHLSYFEADAFARWAGARLPTEAEWESAAAALGLSGGAPDGHGFFGQVWQWTSSAYAPYPGFRPAAGAVGEYNGKFMSGQYVLRGSSCATPPGHARRSYRNFFQPEKRWQFTGLRLAWDA